MSRREGKARARFSRTAIGLDLSEVRRAARQPQSLALLWSIHTGGALRSSVCRVRVETAGLLGDEQVRAGSDDEAMGRPQQPPKITKATVKPVTAGENPYPKMMEEIHPSTIKQ